MSYKVKEIFYTLQGEGTHAGRPAVFCRFASCNLWTGHEKDRARAICQFCDTDFVGTDGPGGGKFVTPAELAAAVADKWPLESRANRMVVCTGGEPLLQLDEAAVDALHAEGFYVAVETNGTQAPPPGIDWLCVSPKIGAPLVIDGGHELKLVYPQDGGDPAQFEHLAFESFRLQPMDSPDVAENTKAAVGYCMAHPNWNLSMQTHKYLGIR
ncbi:7-carboxy-7-deazaguanine synthase [Krasilnikoviella flava]|uniref:7-carboxy-7-deazaguanine synthase n=1 Tax=Krasilnikoviella flava TaxID=526729 RepID=A0A1T5KRE3_9MICO|nr:7-carboxy-7-deazaguanine synthase [Krasilnikoviella flava]SKC66344.1 7-carboxy-7-deazaguanine synthase, Cx14CxxC type [Krasilnikoviella flava]